MTTSSSTPIAKRLVGAWKLVSYVEINGETGAKRFPMGDDATGFIIYTHDGYMSAQIQGASRPLFAGGDMFNGTSEEYKAAGRTYLAYSGPYHVDEERSIVTHVVDVSMFPNWVDKDQVRQADFPEGRLQLSFDQPRGPNDVPKRNQLTWERCVP